MEKIIKDYLRGEGEQSLVQLITGERGSGKTTLLMKEMQWGLDNIPNLKILFVCPIFKYESTGKYKWMTGQKYIHRITVFLKYRSSLCEAILGRNPDKKGASRLWLVLEDCGSIGQEFLDCPHAKDLWGVARHLEVNITVLFHSLRGGRMLNPYIRSNLNVLTCFRVNSLLLLKNIYEELVSMSDQWHNFNEFKDDFIRLTASTFEGEKLIRSFQAITIDLSSGFVDQNTKGWVFGGKDTKNKDKKSCTPIKIPKHGKRSRSVGSDESETPRKVEKVLCEEETDR